LPENFGGKKESHTGLSHIKYANFAYQDQVCMIAEILCAVNITTMR